MITQKSKASNIASANICIYLWLMFFFIFTMMGPDTSHAIEARPEQIKQQINARNSDIANLEKEIADYQKQIDSLNNKASTLSQTIDSLTLTQKKLASDIRLTEKKISAKNTEIKELSLDISDHEKSIDDDKDIIGKLFTLINEGAFSSPIEIILGEKSISKISQEIAALSNIQSSLRDRISQFEENKIKLINTKSITEKARLELLSLKKQLDGQRAVAKAASDEQTQLLKATKRSESEYQKILAEKLRLKEALEQEILRFESELKTAIDKSRLPTVGSLLSWPLNSIRITQLFGNTAFASSRPEIYNGKGHTGIDFAASIGTPVKSAMSGKVIGTGNTDLVPRCYSYGKWVMIDHGNGLSTLYAHLSVINVGVGQTVSTGENVGYSGNTGYSTGPHLHFGLYATQGVEIKTFDNSKNCRGAVIPIAPFQAYLNPLSFLPKI